MTEAATSKVMLVTGASRGIGASIACQAARAGYRVVVNYHASEQAAQSLVREIEAAGGEALAVQADVADPGQVQRLFSEIDDCYGRLDVLVNNAGMLTKFRIEDTDPEELLEIYRVNVFSAHYCAAQAVRRMSVVHGGGGGSIINMSSVASRLGGLAGGSAYAATKGAIDSLTLALAKELGEQGIRVNALRPGLISTEIHDVHGGLAQMQEMAKTAVPLGRAGGANEVGDVVLWLASDAASYVHGAIIDVAGGR